MKFISDLLMKLGMHSDKWIAFFTDVITIAIGICVAAFVLWLVKVPLYKGIGKISARTPTRWDNMFFDKKFFDRLGWLLVPITLAIFVKYLVGNIVVIPPDVAIPEGASQETIDALREAARAGSDEPGGFLPFLYKLLTVWITFASVKLLGSVMDGVNRIYNTFPGAKDRPIKMFIQVILVFLYAAAIMITISIFTGVSVGGLLTGLAVFASVLMLVFKDTILGFVAGIQLTANNMLRIGDWIEMPSAGADGDVMEVGLTAVKVQNWDKTITTIPPYKLVSESFTNWRGMEESGGRRIKRSVNIDVNSIRYLTAEDIDKLKESTLLKEYITKKQAELASYNANRPAMLDERRLTNIGTFREYMEAWISNNPDINQEMTHMVRQIQPGPTGLPLEVYCFSARQAWVQYEKVQADLFDHFYAVMELFGLKAFQYPSSPSPRQASLSQEGFIPLEERK